MRKLRLVAAVLGLLACGMPDAASARPLRECDPRIEDFWHNIGCADEWKERVRVRVRALEMLEAEHERLLRRNASLREQIGYEKAAVAELNRQIAEINGELDRLRRTELSQANYRQVLETLRYEIENVVLALDVASRLRVGCDSTAYEASMREARAARDGMIEFREEMDSILRVVNVGTDVMMLVLPPGRLYVIIEKIAQATGILQGISWVAGQWLERAPITVSERARCD